MRCAFFALVFFATIALVAGSCSALEVSPEWDPDSLRSCSVSRRSLIDRMFDNFDPFGTGAVNATMVYCVFNAEGVFTDAQRALVDGGADSIVLYCDSEPAGVPDGLLYYDEVLRTHTCAGNCSTCQALSVALSIIEASRETIAAQCF